MINAQSSRVAGGAMEPLGEAPVSGPGRLAAREIRDLKARDNTTNWRHLARVWLIVAATLGTMIGVEHAVLARGLSLWWACPAALIAITIIGASQHQLGGVIHEGTHFLLFENKKLNELVSDWLAGFAIYTSTHQYRVHHLAHHQFVNDPVRDPDIAQLKESDHWLDFPVAHIDVLRKLARQLWLPNIFRFTIARARYSAVGHNDNPYVEKEKVRSAWPVRAGIFFAVVLPFIINALMWTGEPPLVTWSVLVASYFLIVVYYALLPESAFSQTRLLPVVAHRATAIGRMTFLFIVYGLLTLYDADKGGATWAWDHYGRYWALPLFTTFPLFMMLRQWVQHGNADRGRFTNTRVFLSGPLLRYAVFPWGMDYHLPHHLMASVPHYNLKRLHELMLDDPEYAQKGKIVEGVGVFESECHATGDHSRTHPTILDVLGPKHAPRGEAVYVDNATLEYAQVKDAAAIAREAEKSARNS